MTQILSALATHSLALAVYPGLLTILVLGFAAEIAWTRITQGRWVLPSPLGGEWVGKGLPARDRPSPVVVTVALFSMPVAVRIPSRSLPLSPRRPRSG